MNRRARTLRTAIAVCLAFGLTGCSVLEQISTGAYRNAVADGVVAELKKLGIKLEKRPECHTPDGTKEVLKIDCTARTTEGQPVVVRGEVTRADTRDPREEYIVLVGGREVLRKACLGLSCKEDR